MVSIETMVMVLRWFIVLDFDWESAFKNQEPFPLIKVRKMNCF